MCKLSVIVPGIRPQNWLILYQSIKQSFSQSFEIIFISPYELPNELKEYKNIKHVIDYGSPSRAMDIGLINSVGQYTTWAADDGIFLPNKLNEAYEFLQINKTQEKDIVTCFYVEGSGEDMDEDWYYLVVTPPAFRGLYIDPSYWILNVGLVKTDYLKELGGWDAEIFEVAVMSYIDFAIRAQKNGSKFFLFKQPVFQCNHMPNITGDHAPIHYAHMLNDEPKFRHIYLQLESKSRIHIDLNNWQRSPEIWTRRFSHVL